MTSDESIKELFDNFDTKICSYCEKNILGCHHSTSTFLCEGRFCNEAISDIEVSVDTDVADIKKYIRKLKLENIIK